MSRDPSPNVLTIQEASRLVRRRTEAIAAAIASGALPAYRNGRRTVRIHREHLERWATTPTPPNRDQCPCGRIVGPEGCPEHRPFHQLDPAS